MRADPAEYEFVAPLSLSAVVSLLAKTPGEWLPIAGGTDVMVQYATGKLPARKLVSLWNLPELRRIDVSEGSIAIGAGCTYTDLLEHNIVRREFPLLASAASWTGSVANQNRGTLGGNIVNASPAADSLPALLVYEAELVLISARGERRVKYVDFHTGYKKSLLAPDELIRAICLVRRFTEYIAYSRKVGARNAQAISKICMAGLARTDDGAIKDIRIAAGSVAATPVRLRETERLLTGKRITKPAIDAALIRLAKETAAGEIRPIDDIRSTATYRAAVLGNLVEEFLGLVMARGFPAVGALPRWNRLPPEEAAQEISDCCGSARWAREMASRRPFEDELALLSASGEIWNQLSEQDWLEAFSKHPRIGERKPASMASAKSASWSAQEQQNVATANEAVHSALADANREYEERFGRVFIVCATGKSASEMLELLRLRLHNDDMTELRAAAVEQAKITDIRLRKWLSQ
jgi:OHCU decarboxylase